VPHSLQNLPLLGAPHDGQTARIAAPHSLQNLAPSLFAVPQEAQTTELTCTT
jgi:hypothetical protein